MKDANRPKTPTQPKADPAPQTSAPRSRVLTKADAKTSRRADALFKVLSTDYLLREQFVTDPAQIMSDYVFGERLTEEASDAANQLLFAVMSSPRLRNWMGTYSKHLRGAMPTRHEFAVNFARAVAASGDGLASLALIRGASDAREHFVVQADLLRALIAVMGGRFSSGGTEMSPGGTGDQSWRRHRDESRCDLLRHRNEPWWRDRNEPGGYFFRYGNESRRRYRR